MPFTLSLAAAGPMPPASTDSRAVARSGDEDSAQPGSFGEAMDRSRKSGSEKTTEPVVRQAPAKVVRRQTGADEATAQGSVNPDLAILVRLEARLAAVAIAAPVAGDSSAVGSSDAAEIPVSKEVSGLTSLLGAVPALSNGLVDVPVSMTEKQAAAAPASGLVTNIPKGVELTPAKSRETQAGDSVFLAADTRATTTLADTPRQGWSDSSFGQPGEGPDRLAAALDKQVEQSPVADPTPFAGAGALALPASAMMQQTGSASAPSAAASAVSVILLPEVGSSEWGKALGQQVIHLSAADRQLAELQLNPPGLGPLKVTLSVSDQQMQAAFISAHSSVRAAVETALPQLRALLAESGISLGQTSVSAESQPQTAFSSGQESFYSQSPHQGYQSRDGGVADPLSDQPTAVTRRTGQGLRIDTYA